MAKHRELDTYEMLHDQKYQESLGRAALDNYQPKHRALSTFRNSTRDWHHNGGSIVFAGQHEHFDHLATDDATRIGDLN